MQRAAIVALPQLLGKSFCVVQRGWAYSPNGIQVLGAVIEGRDPLEEPCGSVFDREFSLTKRRTY